MAKKINGFNQQQVNLVPAVLIKPVNLVGATVGATLCGCPWFRQPRTLRLRFMTATTWGSRYDCFSLYLMICRLRESTACSTAASKVLLPTLAMRVSPGT